MTETPVDETVDEGIAPPSQKPLSDLPDRIRVDDDPDPDGADEQKPEDTVTELTEEEREQFKTLLTVGRRTKKITVLDHAITIASLNCDDEIRVGAKTKEHRDSQAYGRAYQCAVVAASIRSVDGQSWENTLEANPDPDVVFENKHEKVRQFYPLVVQYVYSEVIKLDSEFAALAEKLGKL